MEIHRDQPAVPRVLAVVERPELLEQVAAVADEVGVGIGVGSPGWLLGVGTADAVLVVDHLLADAVVGRLDSASVFVVGLPGEELGMVAACRVLGSQHAAELPRASAWLAEQLEAHWWPGELDDPGIDPSSWPVGAGRSSEAGPLAGTGIRTLSSAPLAASGEAGGNPATGGPCIAVLPACGGAGASTVALALAVAAARNADTLLVAADPWASGLDVCAGTGTDSEVRGWGAIAADAEVIDPESLRSTLPNGLGFWMLGDPGSVPGDVPPALPAVLAAGRAGFGYTIVDLGRSVAGVAAAGTCDIVVLVLPASLPGVLGARRILQQWGEPGERRADLAAQPERIVLACRKPGGLTTETVADYLGCEVVLRLGNSRLVAERWASGEAIHGRTGRRLESWGRTLLEALR